MRLNWAMASHKSQGLTLPRTISDLGPSESIPGLAYVALSRMMKLSNLVIEPSSYESSKIIRQSSNFLYII